MTLGDTASDQRLGSMSGGSGRKATGEGSDERDANGLVVVAGRVSSLASPATSGVHLTISANQEVVADIGPAVGIDVLVLDLAHLGDAGRLGGAGRSGRVMDDGVGSWSDGQHGGRHDTATPLLDGDDSRAGCKQLFCKLGQTITFRSTYLAPRPCRPTSTSSRAVSELPSNCGSPWLLFVVRLCNWFLEMTIQATNPARSLYTAAQ